jgi:hypothetical protein
MGVSGGGEVTPPRQTESGMLNGRRQLSGCSAWYDIHERWHLEGWAIWHWSVRSVSSSSDQMSYHNVVPVPLHCSLCSRLMWLVTTELHKCWWTPSSWKKWQLFRPVCCVLSFAIYSFVMQFCEEAKVCVGCAQSTCTVRMYTVVLVSTGL